MRSISRTLMILLIPIFIGCASKIKIDELSIEGEVYDEACATTLPLLQVFLDLDVSLANTEVAM